MNCDGREFCVKKSPGLALGVAIANCANISLKKVIFFIQIKNSPPIDWLPDADAICGQDEKETLLDCRC